MVLDVSLRSNGNFFQSDLHSFRSQEQRLMEVNGTDTDTGQLLTPYQNKQIMENPRFR